ncbi:hypothetical protein [Streptomyces chattanoogensis]|uniref:hypothetical protein n=1 Tax=Streptomyces chattanoogensis TaxID=66876 RepID=UPI003692D70B
MENPSDRGARGVGHYVTELAAAAGAQATAVTRDAERGAQLAALGAADIVHDVADTATALTDLRDRRIRGKAVLTLS